jgi:hypothetical protein
MKMKSLRTTVLSAAFLASAGLFATPASADTVTFVDLANKICALSYDGEKKLSASEVVQSFGLSDGDKAAALGEASRQLAAKNCKETQGEIDKALADLKSKSQDAASLQVAYDKQKNSGQMGEVGDGTKGQYVDEKTEVADTIIEVQAGEAISK